MRLTCDKSILRQDNKEDLLVVTFSKTQNQKVYISVDQVKGG